MSTTAKAPMLGYYDPAKKVSITAKLGDALVRYEARTGIAARIVFVNLMDAERMGEIAGIEIQARHWVPTNTFYVGIAGEEES